MNAAQARAELGDGLMGVVAGLMGMDDRLVIKLYEAVPERGEALWVRFRNWRDAQPDKGGDDPFEKWVGTIVTANLLA